MVSLATGNGMEDETVLYHLISTYYLYDVFHYGIKYTINYLLSLAITADVSCA